jgi:hypothetical protein
MAVLYPEKRDREQVSAPDNTRKSGKSERTAAYTHADMFFAI